MPLRILRLRGLVSASLVTRLPRHRHVLDVLPRHAVPRARPPLQRAADRRGVPALDDHRRRPLAGHHRAAGRSVRAAARARPRAWRARSSACSCSAPSGRTPRFFPTIFFACFAIGLGIGSAFMPLLTIAMADVPAADAGLGSGITNVSQQISGALGLAVLSTIAANHTKGLLAAHHGLTELPDRRLPPRVPRRRGDDRRRHRPRLRAPAAAPRGAGAPTRQRPRGRRRRIASTSTSKEKPHDTSRSLSRPRNHVKPSEPPLAARRAGVAPAAEYTLDLRRRRGQLHPRHLAATPSTPLRRSFAPAVASRLTAALSGRLAAPAPAGAVLHSGPVWGVTTTCSVVSSK